ncbi:MAG: YdbL family protein [Janthinobacterium lividum]
MTRNPILIAAALAALVGGAGGALAQREPGYAAARSAGAVGEQPDGYLGIVGAATPELRALVGNINIQRKAKYTQSAEAGNATVEQMAFTSGCNLIGQTAPGEKYRSPDGVWKTRTAAAPERDSRCL